MPDALIFLVTKGLARKGNIRQVLIPSKDFLDVPSRQRYASAAKATGGDLKSTEPAQASINSGKIVAEVHAISAWLPCYGTHLLCTCSKIIWRQEGKSAFDLTSFAKDNRHGRL